MKCHVAICDDNSIDTHYLSNLLDGWARENGIWLRIDCFPSAEAFLFRYAGQKDYDILLLDIEMGQMDGVALARTVRRENETVEIIFVTGYSDYISEGYDVSALHYLMKPIDTSKLFQVMDRAVKRLASTGRVLTLEVSGGTVRIPCCEIRYLEVCKNYVTIHGKQDYVVKKTLGELQDLLGTEDGFFRTGRSYLLNLTHVVRVSRTEAYMDDGSAVPLPRGMYEPLNRAIINGAG